MYRVLKMQKKLLLNLNKTKMKLDNPKNQHALLIRMLIDYGNRGFSMKEACSLLFYKFQTRMGELERSLDEKGVPRKTKLMIQRLPMKKKNRFGHHMRYIHYKSIAPVSYLINLYKKINKGEGLKSK